MPTTNYPTSLDNSTSLPNPGATDLLASPTTNLLHNNQHDIVNDAVKALETKVGITNSLVATTHDYLINNQPVTWSALQTYSSGVLVTGSDGNIYHSLVGSNLNNNPTTDAGTNWEAFYFFSNVTLTCGTTGSGQRFTDGGSGINTALNFIQDAQWNSANVTVTIQTSSSFNVSEPAPIVISFVLPITITGNTATPTNCVINFPGSTTGFSCTGSGPVTIQGFKIIGPTGSQTGVSLPKASKVTLNSCIITDWSIGATSYGGSVLSCTSCTFTANVTGIACATAVLSAPACTFSSNTSMAVEVEVCGFADVRSCGFTSNGTAILVTESSICDTSSSTFTSNTLALSVANLAYLNASGCTFSSNVTIYNTLPGVLSANGALIYTGTSGRRVASIDTDIFGNGAMGAATISTNTALTTDMYYTNLTVNSGVTLSTGGYRIFCSGTCAVNGTIDNSGGAGGNGGNGTASAGGTAGIAGTPGIGAQLGGGTVGELGEVGGFSGGGSTGFVPSAAIGMGGICGSSGAGGEGTSGFGGTGISAPGVELFGYYQISREMAYWSAGTFMQLLGGTGGGSGGSGGGTSGVAGGGGSGGGGGGGG